VESAIAEFDADSGMRCREFNALSGDQFRRTFSAVRRPSEKGKGLSIKVNTFVKNQLLAIST
jgi:hypothetical protein